MGSHWPSRVPDSLAFSAESSSSRASGWARSLTYSINSHLLGDDGVLGVARKRKQIVSPQGRVKGDRHDAASLLLVSLVPTNLLKMPKLGPRFRKTTSAREHSEGTQITEAPLTNTSDPFHRSENPRFRKGKTIST